jgi:hypothetical protein
MLSNVVCLHHDNSHLYNVLATVCTIQNLWFRIIPHPLYSLAPSDIYMFRPLNAALQIWHFTVNVKVKQVVQLWLKTNNFMPMVYRH